MTTWEKLEQFADECCENATLYREKAVKEAEAENYDIAIINYCCAVYWWLRPAIDNQPRELKIADEAYVDAKAAERLTGKTSDKRMHKAALTALNEAETRLKDLDEMYWDNFIYR